MFGKQRDEGQEVEILLLAGERLEFLEVELGVCGRGEGFEGRRGEWARHCEERDERAFAELRGFVYGGVTPNYFWLVVVLLSSLI